MDARGGSDVLAPLSPERQREMALVTGVLYASGGILVLVSALIARWPGAHLPLLVAISVAAIATGLVVPILTARLRLRVADFAALAVVGSTVVGGAIIAAGPSAAALYGIFFVYVAAYSAYYYPRWVAIAEVSFAFLAYGVALLVTSAPVPVATWLVVTAASVIGGGLIGALGQGERTALERELAAAEQLHEIETMKDIFLRSISHELRTPLTAVTGYTHLLQQRGHQLDDDIRSRLVERLADASTRLEGLILELLEMRELTSGVASFAPTTVDLAAIVTAQVDRSATDRRIDLVVTSTPLEADPDRLRMLVDALLDNALRHTPTGTPVTIEVRPGADATAVLVVQDEGPGIPEAVRARLTRPFTHGPASAVSASPGAGIGLALAAGVADLHDGVLRADDRPGGGTRIEVRLPAALARLTSPCEHGPT